MELFLKRCETNVTFYWYLWAVNRVIMPFLREGIDELTSLLVVVVRAIRAAECYRRGGDGGGAGARGGGY